MRPKASRPSEVEALMLRLGFVFVREGKGSHRIYAHPDGRKTSVSFHPGDVPTGTLRKIIQQAGITIEEFNASV